jgi:hypothetical protein
MEAIDEDEINSIEQAWVPDPSEVDIHSVAFRPDGAIEISFDETRDITEGAVLAKTVIFLRTVLTKDAYEEVLTSLRDWVDEGLLYIRNTRDGVQ